MLAYADAAVTLGNNRHEVTYTVEKLIPSSRCMGFVINETKTKYIMKPRYTRIDHDFIAGPYAFEHVKDYKYLGVDIIHENDMHNEVNLGSTWRIVFISL